MRVEPTERAEDVVRRMAAQRSGRLVVTIGTGCCESTAPFLYEDHMPGPDTAVVGLSGALAFFDISDPNQPLFMSQMALSTELVAVDADGSRAVALGRSSLSLIDFSDPAAPIW